MNADAPPKRSVLVRWVRRTLAVLWSLCVLLICALWVRGYWVADNFVLVRPSVLRIHAGAVRDVRVTTIHTFTCSKRSFVHGRQRDDAGIESQR